MAEPCGATAQAAVRFLSAAPIAIRLGSQSGESAALKPRRGGLETYPRHQSPQFAGSDPSRHRSVHEEPKGLAPLGNPNGARAGSAYLPCKEIELGSSPRCSTKYFPDRPTAGHPVVNRPIQVRILVGEPLRR